jgi:hypothetical protein
MSSIFDWFLMTSLLCIDLDLYPCLAIPLGAYMMIPYLLGVPGPGRLHPKRIPDAVLFACSVMILLGVTSITIVGIDISRAVDRSSGLRFFVAVIGILFSLQNVTRGCGPSRSPTKTAAP